MSNILILFSTTDGQTRKIAEHLQQVIEYEGHHVQIVPLKPGFKIDLESFDTIVIGASVRYGSHQKLVTQFINRNISVLENKSNAFFSVNVVARKPEKCSPETNPYVQKFLSRITWKPQHIAVFAGKIDYPSYRFWDRQMIRLILWMTNGPTDPETVVEFTNWNHVEAFGRLIARCEQRSCQA